MGTKSLGNATSIRSTQKGTYHLLCTILEGKFYQRHLKITLNSHSITIPNHDALDPLHIGYDLLFGPLAFVYCKVGSWDSTWKKCPVSTSRVAGFGMLFRIKRWNLGSNSMSFVESLELDNYLILRKSPPTVFFQRDPHIPFFSFLRVCTGAIVARMASSNTSSTLAFNWWEFRNKMKPVSVQSIPCIWLHWSLWLSEDPTKNEFYSRWNLFVSYNCHSLFCKSLVCLFVFSEIHFETNKDNRNLRAVPCLSTIRNHLPVMMHFWLPFSWHTLQRGGIRDRKANQKDICLRVAERSKPG